MKKVLIVACDGLENAGVQNVIMSIVRNLHRKYIFDIVLFNNRVGYFDEEFLSYGGHIFRLPEYNGSVRLLKKVDNYTRWLTNHNKVKRIIRDNGPYAAIHCNNDYDGWYLLQIAKQERIPIRISHVHRIVQPVKGDIKRVIFQGWMKQILTCSTKKIGCSVNANSAFYGESEDSIVVNNPYNSKRFDPEKYTKNKDKQVLSIIQIGSFCDNKNQLFTLEIFRKILMQEPSARLFFVGFELEDGYLRKIKEYICKEKIETSVSFYPNDADTPALLSISNYMIFPSKIEGFGVVLIEAQAMGVSCYVSDTVPREADVGGCTYLSLKDGPEIWSNIILQDFHSGSEKKYCDCSKYDSRYISEIFDKIYSEAN